MRRARSSFFETRTRCHCDDERKRQGTRTLGVLFFKDDDLHQRTIVLLIHIVSDAAVSMPVSVCTDTILAVYPFTAILWRTELSTFYLLSV